MPRTYVRGFLYSPSFGVLFELLPYAFVFKPYKIGHAHFLNSLTSAMVSPAFKIIVVTSPSLMYLHVCNIIVPSS